MPVTQTVKGRFVEIRPITHLEYDKIKNDPFKGPDYDKVLRLMYDGKVELIPSTSCTVGRYKYRYIKKPQRVVLSTNTTFELSDHLHDEIVAEAILIALEGIEAKRQQSFPNINNTKE